LNKALEQIIR